MQGFPSDQLYGRGGMGATLPYMMHPSFMMHGHHGYNSYGNSNLNSRMKIGEFESLYIKCLNFVK